MNLPANILELNQIFYNQNEKRQDEMLAELLNFANANRNIIENLIPVANDEELDVLTLLFEALAQDAGQWSDYYLLAVDQLLAKAKTTDKPYDVLTHLDAYTFLTDKPDFKHKAKNSSINCYLCSHTHIQHSGGMG